MPCLECANCGNHYQVDRFDPTQSYRCRARQSLLARRLDETPHLLDAAGQTGVADAEPEMVPDTPAPKIEKIGKYQIVGEVGRGGTGVVYEAIDPALGRRVALKVMLASRNVSPEEAELEEERCFRESRLTANLPKCRGENVSATLDGMPVAWVIMGASRKGPLQFNARGGTNPMLLLEVRP